MEFEEPTIDGMVIDHGMHIDDVVPDCCYGPMDVEGKKPCTCCRPEDTEGEGTGIHIVYTCDNCATVVEVSGLGLVHDIREKTSA